MLEQDRQRDEGMLYRTGVSSPHPVPLPMGEGTP